MLASSDQSALDSILAKEDTTILVGVYDALSAKLAEQAGAKAVVLGGYAVSAVNLGEPDFGLLTQTEIIDVAKQINKAINIPLIVDGDTGYGGPLNVIRLVNELLSIKAAGVILEDQVWPKRCGHMENKAVIPMEDHVAKIKAAVYAKQDNPFLIIARTDARGVNGLNDAIVRGKAYYEAGADVIFIEALLSIAEMEQVAKEIEAPLLLNNIEGGKTPILNVQQINELGFSMVVYPLTGLFSSTKAVLNRFKNLIENGVSSADTQELLTFAEFNEVIGLQAKYDLSEKFRS